MHATAPIPMLDERSMMHGYDWSSESCAGWWASEKFRGCRAYWCGRRLWTRGGKTIPAPESLLADLPRGVPLDGEIWVGYGAEDESRASIAVRLGAWPVETAFKVFDAPSMPGTWDFRMQIADELIRGATNVQTVHRWEVIGLEHLADIFRNVASRAGEGLVLRDPVQRGYAPGRTRGILKFKQPQYEQLLAEFPHLSAA